MATQKEGRMFRIGVDPGLSGAIALLEEDLALSDVVDMPIMALTGKRKAVNSAALAKILQLYSDGPVTAYLEQVSAMPGQGVSSMFGFGVSYGIVQGVLAALGIPTVFVTPQRWKKRAGLIGKDKDYCRTLMQRRYPHAELDLKKHIGRADAIAIALYGRDDTND